MKAEAIVALWLGACLVGCSSENAAEAGDSAGDAAGSAKPASLSEVKVSPSFNFATTHAAPVALTPPAGVTVLGVEVRREGGGLVFTGGAQSGDARFNLPLPPGENLLHVRWLLNSGDTRDDVLSLGAPQEAP
jgi:hypothetical protein